MTKPIPRQLLIKFTSLYNRSTWEPDNLKHTRVANMLKRILILHLGTYMLPK